MNLQKEKQHVYKLIDRFFGLDTIKIPGTGLDTWNEYKARQDLKREIYAKLANLGICLCGGAITSVITGDKVNDLDFYVKSPMNKAAADIFFRDWFRGDVPFISVNAINYKRKQGNRVYHAQLITRFTGEPKDIFDWFDFTVCMGAFDFEKDNFEFDPRFFTDVASRRLVYGGKSMYPICAMYRTLKYQKKGYKLPGSTVMHIALSIVRLDIQNYGQLKEQLMGIDTSYLQGLLNNRGDYRDDLPVDYGKFLEDAFNSIDGFQAEDEKEDLE